MYSQTGIHCRDYWARFERFVNLLTRTCDDVYIVTGPLYLPSVTPMGYRMSHPMIGELSETSEGIWRWRTTPCTVRDATHVLI